MWEFLIKLNPKLIRFYGKRKGIDYLLNIAADKGYTPTFSDLKFNKNLRRYFRRNEEKMKDLIKSAPRSIIFYDGDDETLIEAAIKNGYKPTLQDVKESHSLHSSDSVFFELIKDDPKAVVFYRGYNEKIIEEAIKNGYKPTVRDIKSYEYLCAYDSIMYKLIEDDPRNIVFYNGHNKNITNDALERGYKPTVHDVERYDNLSYNDLIIRELIKEDPRNVIFYKGSNTHVIDEAIAKGYKPTLQDIKEHDGLCYMSSIIRELIKEDPRNVIFYRGSNTHVIDEALARGYKPTLQDIKEHNELCYMDSIILELIKDDPRNVVFYTGDNQKVIETALARGYKPTLKDIEEHHLDFYYYNDLVFFELIKDNPKNVVFYAGNNEKVIEAAIEKGYKPTLQDLKKYHDLCYSDSLFLKLIKEDPKNIIFYRGYNTHVIDEAVQNGYEPTKNDLQNNNALGISDIIMHKLIEKDPSCIALYTGNNEEIISKAIEGGYEPTKKILYNNPRLCSSDTLMRKLVKDDPNCILLYTGNNEEIIKYAMDNGYIPSKEDLSNNKKLKSSVLIMQKLISEDMTNINLYRSCDEEIMTSVIKTFGEIYGVNVPNNYAELFKVYRHDLSKFCLNYDLFSQFLSGSDISEEVFCQYAFGSSYRWIDDIKEIAKSDKLKDFIKVKEYFFNNYYFHNEEQNNISTINAFLNILENYKNYPELCQDIIRQNRELTKEEISNINLLFRLKTTFDESIKPTKVEDLNNLTAKIKDEYESQLRNYDTLNIDELKNTLCQLIFNDTYRNVVEKLSIYGDTETLRLLAFNNRNHPHVEKYIRKMMVYTSSMESIVNIKDKEGLKIVIDRVLDNFEEVINLSSHFASYETKMRTTYEMDFQENPTKFDNIKNKEDVIDKEKTAKYGVEVLDYSDKRYCIATHVKSRSETPEELINGTSSGKKNFICLTPASNRNQVYYTKPGKNKIIFATDTVPNGLFLQSSVKNMGSNLYIKANNSEVTEIRRRQRGVVETSQAPNGNNSEILSYREGLKFQYIVLPGGREPTEEELSLAKEYNLKFIITQNVSETVKEPKDIEMLEEKNESRDEPTLDNEMQMMDRTLLSYPSSQRKIAILTDAHGLFEPTLAVLEDAYREGITEIYSLGDNVGTGPNPSEVMDLLDEYGVVSLVGNHELYVSLGVDEFKEHLDKSGGYQEAKSSTAWTSSQLTAEQKEKIKLYDQFIELVVGGEKILLCHDTKNFNNGTMMVNAADYSEVFRGHIHFSGQDGNVTTIPGVGIGTNAGRATYMILTENANGGYTRELKTIPYNRESLKYGIGESSMSYHDRNKIESWAGVSDGTRKR